jgi:predicted TIM-barrel fold metal-dependent hydrolase
MRSSVDLANLSTREWVGKCLGQMTDANRTEAQAELKKVIADAFSANTLWTTDWPKVKLQRHVCVTEYVFAIFTYMRQFATQAIARV